MRRCARGPREGLLIWRTSQIFLKCSWRKHIRKIPRQSQDNEGTIPPRHKTNTCRKKFSGNYFSREYMRACTRTRANTGKYFWGVIFCILAKFLREIISGRIHVAPVFAPARIQENTPGELFMYWFRARGYCEDVVCVFCCLWRVFLFLARWCPKPIRLHETRMLRSEKLQNESFPNFSNFRPEFTPNFAPNFPEFLEGFSCFVRGKRRPEKIHQKSPPFFNAKFPSKYKKEIHKFLLESRQSNNYYRKLFSMIFLGELN